MSLFSTLFVIAIHFLTILSNVQHANSLRVVCQWLRLVSIYYSIRTHVHVTQILGALTSGVWAVFRGINVNKSNVTFSIVVIGRCDYLVLMTITRLNVCVKTEYVAR